MTDIVLPRTFAPTVTTNSTLVAGQHNPVDATSGSLTMAVPSGTVVGGYFSVEKVDSSANPVVISGNIRGTFGTTVRLVGTNDSVELYWNGSTWWPINGRARHFSKGTTPPVNPAVGDLWIDAN